MSHSFAVRLTRRRRLKPPPPSFWCALIALAWDVAWLTVVVVISMSDPNLVVGVVGAVRGASLACGHKGRLWLLRPLMGTDGTWPVFKRELKAWRDGE